MFKQEVKIAQYLLQPVSPFLEVYGLKSCQGLETGKKRMRPMFGLLDPISLVNKRFIIWSEDIIFLWGIGVILTRQDNTILPARVAKHCT